jgi:hypothetical protein
MIFKSDREESTTPDPTTPACDVSDPLINYIMLQSCGADNVGMIFTIFVETTHEIARIRNHTSD